MKARKVLPMSDTLPSNARAGDLSGEPLPERLLHRVDRAVSEMRRGAPVVVHDASGAVLVLAAEAGAPEGARRLEDLSGHAPLLALSARRAHDLGVAAPERGDAVMRLELKDPYSAPIDLLADPCAPGDIAADAIVDASPGDPLAIRALTLAKLARLLPAALLSPLAAAEPVRWADEHALVEISADELRDYRSAAARGLRKVADARVPLLGAENARVHAFRPPDGGVEHLAIVIGEPRPDEAVLTRVHSECFTGDLLGSLRCDCGDQLRGAIASMAEAGAGVLLYLAQEGRGIGLVNKLRAYRLQDKGADTLEANEALGFDADERIYEPAGEMLRQLGLNRVRLLTNNPDKVTALALCGVDVVERVPHHFPSNDHNEQYLSTKARRFGHLY